MLVRLVGAAAAAGGPAGPEGRCRPAGTMAAVPPLERIRGHPALQLPCCAALVQYGGGDDMRTAEPLLTLPLHASAFPSAVKEAAYAATDDAVARRNAGGFDALVADHVASAWDRASCTWDVAFAVTTEVMPGSGWCNLWFHGWLFDPLIHHATADGAALPYAAQRFPLVGAWPLPGVGGLSAWEEDVPAFGDARCAGISGNLQPCDQHTCLKVRSLQALKSLAPAGRKSPILRPVNVASRIIAATTASSGRVRSHMATMNKKRSNGTSGFAGSEDA